MKKAFSLFLALLMAMSVMSISAYATETDSAKALPGNCSNGHTYLYGTETNYINYGNEHYHRIETIAIYTCGVCGYSYSNLLSSELQFHTFDDGQTENHISQCICGCIKPSPVVPSYSEDE